MHDLLPNPVLNSRDGIVAAHAACTLLIPHCHFFLGEFNTNRSDAYQVINPEREGDWGGPDSPSPDDAPVNEVLLQGAGLEHKSEGTGKAN